MDCNLIIQARRTNIEEYLRSRGEILLKEGKQFRVENHSGLMVSGNRWYSHTFSTGGNTLDYLIEMEHFDFKKAVEILTTKSFPSVKHKKTICLNQVVIPARNTNDNRVLSYLTKTRMLNRDVVVHLINQGHIYESADSHNCIFTGIDEASKIKYVMQRSSLPNSTLKFESIGSDKRYSFSLKGHIDILCIFESPIDLLSYTTIYSGYSRTCSHMLSLGGVSDIALESYIQRNSDINKLVFCLDNDDAGRQAFNLFFSKYSVKGFKVYKHFPVEKDWNLQLLSRSG